MLGASGPRGLRPMAAPCAASVHLGAVTASAAAVGHAWGSPEPCSGSPCPVPAQVLLRLGRGRSLWEVTPRPKLLPSNSGQDVLRLLDTSRLFDENIEKSSVSSHLLNVIGCLQICRRDNVWHGMLSRFPWRSAQLLSLRPQWRNICSDVTFGQSECGNVGPHTRAGLCSERE